MSLLPPQDAANWIRSNYSPEFYDKLIRDANYAMYGIDEDSIRMDDIRRSNFYGVDDIPAYAEIVPTNGRVGISRRFLTDCFMALNIHMGARPKPLYMGIDPVTSSLRAAAYDSRYDGIGLPSTAGEWAPAKNRAFQDIFLLGMGGVQLGVRETGDGLFYLTQQYVPAHCIVVDRMCTPYQAGRAVATVHYVSKEYAWAFFGEEPKASEIETLEMGDRMRKFEVVRIVTYRDVGLNGHEPTHIIWKGTLDAKPHTHTYNDFECLDVAIGEFYRPPGLARPFGRVSVSAGTVAMRNAMERYVMNHLEQTGEITILNQKFVDVDALTKAQARGDRFVPSLDALWDKDEPLIQSIQPKQLPQEMLGWFNYIDSLDNMESNTTDMDNGMAVKGDQSATEISLMAERADRRNALLSREVRAWFTRHAQIASSIMRVADTHPCQVSVPIDGRDYRMLLNDPNDPAMDMSRVFSEQTRIVMDEAAMTAEDLSRAKARRIDDLQRLMAQGLVGMQPGMVSLEWVVRQYLDTMGVKDPEVAMVAVEQMMQQPQAGAPPTMDPAALMGGSMQEMMAAAGAQPEPAQAPLQM